MLNPPGSCIELRLACGCMCQRAPAVENGIGMIQYRAGFLPQYLVLVLGWVNVELDCSAESQCIFLL